MPRHLLVELEQVAVVRAVEAPHAFLRALLAASAGVDRLARARPVLREYEYVRNHLRARCLRLGRCGRPHLFCGLHAALRRLPLEGLGAREHRRGYLFLGQLVRGLGVLVPRERLLRHGALAPRLSAGDAVEQLRQEPVGPGVRGFRGSQEEVFSFGFDALFEQLFEAFAQVLELGLQALDDEVCVVFEVDCGQGLAARVDEAQQLDLELGALLVEAVQHFLQVCLALALDLLVDRAQRGQREVADRRLLVLEVLDQAGDVELGPGLEVLAETLGQRGRELERGLHGGLVGVLDAPGHRHAEAVEAAGLNVEAGVLEELER